MGDNRTDLPEGTDAVIAGASNTDETTGAVTTETTLTETDLPAPRDDLPTSGAPDTGIRQRIRDGGERLSTEAGDRARGLVSQGLERSAEALTNVSRMVGETADGLEERLGAEYGDDARRAATAIESTRTLRNQYTRAGRRGRDRCGEVMAARYVAAPPDPGCHTGAVSLTPP